MSLRRLIWSDGRFSWFFVAGTVIFSLLLLAFDYYWRTHDTAFLRFW